MREFLIKRTDGDGFDLHASRLAEVLRPRSFPSTPTRGWGDFCLDVRGCRIAFSYEVPGWQVYFEHDVFTAAEARQIVTEIAESITAATGQQSQVIQF